MTRTPAEERFWQKVDKTGECWNWIAGVTTEGYSCFRLPEKNVLGHRWIYQRINGPLPRDLHLDHLCRNRRCVNPDHLEPVTNGENLLRSPLTFNAINAGKTHCPRGHPFDEVNTYRWRGRRFCKPCCRQRTREWRANKRRGNDQNI